MDTTQQKVLAAFEVEYKEHLECLRSLLVALLGNDDVAPRLNEAFRRVHSLKGGARVCGLQGVEEIAHDLESHFARLREGTSRLDRPAIAIANDALDAIEDCMAALEDSASAAPPRAIPTANVKTNGTPTPAVDAHLQNVGALRANPNAELAELTVQQRVLAAFQAEYQTYVTGIRTFTGRLKAARETVEGGDWQEPLRFAHSLRDGARAAGVELVERLAHDLETKLLQQRDDVAGDDQQGLDQLQMLLASIESAMIAAGSPAGSGHDRSTEGESLETTPPAPADPKPAEWVEAPSVVAPLADTVRVSVASLDQLLHSSGQFVADALHHEELASQSRRLNQQLDDLARHRAGLRTGVIAGSVRHVPNSVARQWERYLDAADRQTDAVRATARRIQRLHQRSAWLAKSRGQQLYEDVLRTCMTPAESVFQGFRKLVRDLAADQGKQVDFQITGMDARADRKVLQALKDPVIHMLCNAVVHGIETPAVRRRKGKCENGQLSLTFETLGHRLVIAIEDDGVGIDRARVGEVSLESGVLSATEAQTLSAEDAAAIVFRAGFSTSQCVTKTAGRGMGLSVVQEAVARLQGDVHVRQHAGPGATFVVSVPVTVATHHLMLVARRDDTFAIPVHSIERLLRIKVAEIVTIEGRPVVTFRSQPIPLVGLAHMLGGRETDLRVAGGVLPVVIIRSGAQRVALAVDEMLAEGEFLIKQLSGPASAYKNFAGGIVLGNGKIALVLDPDELLKGLAASRHVAVTFLNGAKAVEKPSTILVVDDSFTTRTLEKSILETHGYTVRVAVDGLEALAQLNAGEDIGLVISDVQMPRLDGFGLLDRIKGDPRLKHTPVILVTSLDGREDRERGMALGANAYIIKRKFDHEDLLSTIERIIPWKTKSA